MEEEEEEGLKGEVEGDLVYERLDVMRGKVEEVEEG